MWAAGAAVVLAGIGAADALTDPEVTFSLFYMIPVAMTAWGCGRNTASGYALLSAAAWGAVDFGKGRFRPHLMVYAWHFGSRTFFLLALTAVLVALRRALARERDSSHRDDLTGAFNRRAFNELAERELHRAQRLRQPFTLLYIDVDHFKALNDTRGHAVGDELLKTVARLLMTGTRTTDIVSRFGGDEFVVLLPVTDADAARGVVLKLRVQLMEAVRAGAWPVTFSVGVLTSCGTSSSVGDLIRRADALMYGVKGRTKDGVRFSQDEDAVPGATLPPLPPGA